MDKYTTIQALSALAQETRLAAFRFLVTRLPHGANAGEIAKRCRVPHNTMSTHLAILERANLVDSERHGREMIYRVEVEGFRSLVGFLLRDCCGGRTEMCGTLAENFEPPKRIKEFKEKVRG